MEGMNVEVLFPSSELCSILFFPSCCILPNFFPFFCVLFYLERVELWWWIVVAAGFFFLLVLPLRCPCFALTAISSAGFSRHSVHVQRSCLPVFLLVGRRPWRLPQQTACQQHRQQPVGATSSYPVARNAINKKGCLHPQGRREHNKKKQKKI